MTMNSLQQDIERGPEMSQLGGNNVPIQSSTPIPSHMMNTREMPRSFSPVAQPSSRPMSQYPSGLPQSLDSPVLSAFRYHIGIHNDPSLVSQPYQVQGQKQEGSQSRSVTGLISNLAGTLSSSNTAVSNSAVIRPVSNLGIYSRVVVAERKYHREYKIFSILINGALGLQIIFAAALTALGAGNGPHTAVTAFGSLNTVLAGLLTFLKGSGLPNRLKYYENEWTKLREYIEQRERDFATDAHQGRLGWDDMAEEIHLIEQRYEGVRKDIEANTPDSYVSVSNAIRAIQSNSNNNNNNNAHNNNNTNNTANNAPPMTGVAGKLSRLNSQIGQHNMDARHTAKDLDGRIRNGLSDLEHRISKGWNDLEKQAAVHVREVADETTDRARDAGKQAEYRMASMQHNVGDGMRRTQTAVDSRLHDAENRMYDAQNAARSNLYNAQNSLQTGLYNAQNAAQAGLYNAQNIANSTIREAQNAGQTTINNAQNSVYNAQNATSSAIHDAQTAAQQGYFNAQDVTRSNLLNAQHASQEAIHNAQAATNARLDEERHHAESKAKEVEDKVMMVAEKAAEKVLEFTKHRH